MCACIFIISFCFSRYGFSRVGSNVRGFWFPQKLLWHECRWCRNSHCWVQWVQLILLDDFPPEILLLCDCYLQKEEFFCLIYFILTFFLFELKKKKKKFTLNADYVSSFILREQMKMVCRSETNICQLFLSVPNYLCRNGFRPEYLTFNSFTE